MNLAKFFQPDPAQPAIPTNHVALPPLDVQALTAAEAVASVAHTTPDPTALVSTAAPQINPVIDGAKIDEPELITQPIVEEPIIPPPKKTDDITLNVSDTAHQTDEIVGIIPHDS